MRNKTRKNLTQEESADIILTIPHIYTESCKNDDILAVITKFNNAKTVEQQITTIHSFSAFLNENAQIPLEILTYIFATANSKHPVKKSILRIFSSTKNLERQIATELSTQLLKLIESENSNNDSVNSINDCFNNFSAGFLAVNLISGKVFPFLIDTLKIYLKELHGTTSPIAVQEFYKYIHNSTRAIVAVSQQCEQINLIIKNYTTDISKICVEILNNPDILYDTKNNCGIVLTITANTYFDNNYSFLLNTCIYENACISEWGIGHNELKDDLIVSCVFSGILNTTKPETLCKFDHSLNQSDIYKITDKLLEISKNSADKPSIVLGINRTLLLVSRALGPLSTENLNQMLHSLLDHTWTQLDHNVDTIRHVAKSILINLVKLAQQKEENETSIYNTPLNVIITSILNTSKFRNGRYVALSIIGNEVGCKILLQKHPNLIQDLRNLAQEPSISSYVTSCYEHLMRCNLKETTEKDWLQNWVFPLTSELTEDDQLDEKGSCYQKLLINAIKLRPAIVNSILSRWSTDNELQFSSLLKCTLIARKIGADLKDVNKWRGMLDYSILNLAMCHQNDEIRISAISLIAESHKSTEIFTEWELQYVVKYLYYNINTQLPAVRQRILFLIKKILTRFSESYYAIIRNYTKLTERKIDDPVLINQKTTYEKFIFNLRDCIFDSLFPGANFSRRLICLEVLTFLEPILTEVLKVLNISEDKLWKQSEVDALKICLDDSYESNKQLATNLLRKCPTVLLKLQTLESTKEFIQSALNLANSVKPADTVTAAYMLETSINSVIINEALKQLLATEQDYSSEYLMINLLLQHLKLQIEIGKNSLLKAAGSAPMHGTLFCIRHLIEKYLFTSDLTEAYWKQIIEEIIETCFQVSDIVCPVVNSSSPEGHLPMDHETVDSDEEVVTAQMLLVCSWRSIKEVSLLLGEITLRSKIVGENQNGVITESEMLKIGEHFTVLLTETKHRGAFEQAYVGFTKLCNRLWRCKAEKLHQLPITWLNEIISAISEEKSSNNKLCATRRSAGVPFMIQAIVASELQTGSSTHFHQCMNTLLQLANHSGDNIEKRTHAMNILRALYRHTQLGEEISPYIAQGVVASITGFGRTTWAERNSATLLFSSLMTRIFGVQRTKDTDSLSIRNRMTARVFFLRYPILHSFLLNQLKELTSEDCEQYKIVALYPILLLLARLFPANSEDTNNQLEDFIPYVRICAKNKTLKTRELAAKALVPLVHFQQRETLLKELFVLLKNRNESNNSLHGLLLQILYLLPTIKDNNINDLRDEINDSLWLLICNSSNCCPIITAVYMQIISKLLMLNYKQKISDEIFSVISAQDNYILNSLVGTTVYYREALNLQLILLIQQLDASKICLFLFKQIQHEHKDVNEFILNVLIYLLRNNNTAVHIDNLELPDQEKILVSLISEDFKTEIINNLKLEEQFKVQLKILIEKNDNLLHKTLFILNNLFTQNDFKMLDKYFEDQEIICAIISSFPKIVQENSNENLTKVLPTMLEVMSPKYSFTCRFYSALTLLELKPIIFGKSKTDIESLINLWKIVMVLLTDTEPIVRNTISKLAINNPIAEKARKELLSKCVEVITKISEEKCISLLLFWSLTVFDSEDDDDEIELQIFERGETSTYIEDKCLSKLSAKSLSNIIRCNDISEMSEIFGKITTILKADNLWNDYESDCDNLIAVLEEIKQETFPEKYLDSTSTLFTNLDVFNKYKIVNILKSVMPNNIMDE